MKRIILSTIPDDFNLANDIPLGPWCFLGKEKIYPDWFDLEFRDPYRSSEEMASAAKESLLVANRLLPDLAKQLNAINGYSYSMNFWRDILTTWLLTLIQTTQERYDRISHLIERYGREECMVDLADTQDIVWNFADTNDFMVRGVFSAEYNKWIFSSILENRLPEKWSVTRSRLNTGLTKRYRSDMHMDFEIKDIGRKVLEWLRRGHGRVYGFSPLESFLFAVYLGLMPPKNKKYNNIFGNNNGTAKCDLDYNFYAQKTLPDYFLKLKEVLPSINMKAYKKGSIRFGSFFNYDDATKVRFALAREYGELLIGVQHGGNYGNAKVFSVGGEAEYKQDAFISWGWTKQEDCEGDIIPLPSPYLSKIANRYKKRNDDLILVGTRVHMFMYRFDSMPQPAEQLDYLKEKASFLKRLNKEIFKSLKYRPYFEIGSNAAERPYMERRFPGLKLCRGYLHSKIMRCKLLVLDHPGTTLNVALAANIPTICFWNKRSWAMCRQSIPYFEALEKAGILFESGAAAADKANEVWNNVLGWWMLPETQKARQGWCDQYAKTSRTWRRDWLKVFREM